MAQALEKQDSAAEVSTRQSHQTPLNSKEWRHLQKKALYHYEKSLDAKTRSEQTVAHRGHAKDYALQLRAHSPSKAVALNLLARIALDEGFYALAETHLKEAIDLQPDDAGCWYSLGHVRLAQKHYNDALECFTRSLSISPSETRSATSIAYTLAKQGKVVDAFQAYRNLYRVHPQDPHIQAKLFEILPMIRADFYQTDLEEDAIQWLTINQANYQALAPLVISLLTHKYQINNPNAVIDIQDLAKDTLLNLSLGKIYITDNSLERFLILIRKQVLLHCIAGEYNDKALLNLAANIAMHAEHNEHVYIYDDQEKDIVDALKALIMDVGAQQQSFEGITHLIVLYNMYEPIIKLPDFQQPERLHREHWPTYAKALMKHAVTDVLEEIQTSKTIPLLSPVSDVTSLDVKQQYEENPYPRWLDLGYNTPTNYGRALERELIGFRAPDFFNMGTIKVLIAGAGTGRHALKVARFFRNVDVVALDLSTRSLAYAKRQAQRLGIKNVRFICGDILELDKLDEQFHVIECSGVLHHMKYPEQGLNKLRSKLVDRGLLKLGLYSYQARGIVRQIRNIIQQYDVPVSAEGIRTLRQAILEGKMPYDFHGILTSQDFYSMSGCRDLMFHVQEIQYEPKDIKALIEREKLNFLGFIVPESVRSDYAKHYPDDGRLVDLENWQDYERKHPALFAGMFQFYVQK